MASSIHQRCVKTIDKKGIKNIIVITPGFAVDCLETLEEINIEYKELFLKLGGQNLSLVPCLNDTKAAIILINELLKSNI